MKYEKVKKKRKKKIRESQEKMAQVESLLMNNDDYEYMGIVIRRVELSWKLSIQGSTLSRYDILRLSKEFEIINSAKELYDIVDQSCIWYRVFDICVNIEQKFVYPSGIMRAMEDGVINASEVAKEFLKFAMGVFKSHGCFLKLIK